MPPDTVTSFVPEAPVALDRAALLSNLRWARKAAAPGPSGSSLGFSGSACGFGLGVEVSGGSEAVLCSFPRLREAPHPPFWPGRPGHDFASGGRLGRDCCSSTFPLEARIGLALAVRRRSSCRHRPASVRYYRVNTQSCCRSCLCRKVCTCLCTCQQAGRL